MLRKGEALPSTLVLNWRGVGWGGETTSNPSLALPLISHEIRERRSGTVTRCLRYCDRKPLQLPGSSMASEIQQNKDTEEGIRKIRIILKAQARGTWPVSTRPCSSRLGVVSSSPTLGAKTFLLKTHKKQKTRPQAILRKNCRSRGAWVAGLSVRLCLGP